MFYSNMYLYFITFDSNIRLAVPERKVAFVLICKLDMIKIMRSAGSLVGDSRPVQRRHALRYQRTMLQRLPLF